MKRFWLIAAVAVMAAVAVQADLSLSGGQNSFDGESSSFDTNFSINAVPALKFSDSFSLLPIITGEYRTVKETKELADGNILFQKGLNYGLSLKPIWTLSNGAAIKVKAGYMAQQLKEAADEELSSGAFNYNKITIGVDYVPSQASMVGYNYFTVAFPNYQSLLASQTTAQSVVGSGVTAAGTDILDFAAHELFIYKQFTMGQVMLDVTADYLMKSFSDQLVADGVDTLSSDQRSDTSMLVHLFPSIALIPTGPTTMFGGMGISYQSYTSNQGYSDANGPIFTPSYYNYNEMKFAPTINCSFNLLPLTIDLMYEYALRNYSDRLAQDADGGYTTDKMNQTTGYFRVGATYPLKENLNLRLVTSMLSSSSNMKYETVYRYSYNANSIFLGVNYTYK